LCAPSSRYAPSGASIVDRATHLGVHLAEDDGHPGLGDGGLLPGDRVEGIAQLVHVVEGYPRDRRRAGRGDHVRRIEPAADAHLEDREIHLRLAEGEHRRQGHGLEERELRPDLERTREDLLERVVSQRLAVHANPLRQFHQVWRRIEPGLLPRRSRDRLDHRADGSFPVRPRDVHALKGALGVPRTRASVAHRLEAEAHPEGDAGVELSENPRERRGHRAGGALVSRRGS
jgi:hypothetical protein